MKFKKILSSLILSCGMVTLSGCGNNQKYVDIVTVNDLHGWMQPQYGASESAAPTIDIITDKYISYCNADKKANNGVDSTMFLLNGDNVDGAPVSNVAPHKGSTIYSVLNKLGVKYSSVGNHEFNWGLSYLDPNYSNENSSSDDLFTKYWECGQFLACNIFQNNDGQYSHVSWAKPYTVETINDLNIGIVGYTTAETSTTTAKKALNNIEFANAVDNTSLFGDTNETGSQILQDAIDACWNNNDQDIDQGKKPDVVLLLAHEGGTVDVDYKLTSESPISKIINNINGVNACLSAHTHQTYIDTVPDKNGKQILVGQAGKYGTELLKTKIFFDQEKQHFDIRMYLEFLDTNLSYKKLTNSSNELFKTVDEEYISQYNSVKYILEKKYFQINEADGVSPDQDPSLAFEPTPEQIWSPTGQLFNYAQCNLLSESVLNNQQKLIDTDIKISEIRDGLNDQSFKGVDISICNGPTIRSGLTGEQRETQQNQYDVTYNDLYECVPFDNVTVIMKIKVKEINTYYQTFLNSDLKQKLPPNFSSNNNWKISYNGKPFNKSTEIKIVDENSQPIDEEKEIFVAVNQFLFEGGDYSTFNEKSIEHMYLKNTETVNGFGKISIFENARNVFLAWLHTQNPTGKFGPLNMADSSASAYWHYDVNQISQYVGA